MRNYGLVCFIILVVCSVGFAATIGYDVSDILTIDNTTAIGHGLSDSFKVENRSVAGAGASSLFSINNRDAVQIRAVNNWDGTVTVSWTNAGQATLVRVHKGGSSNTKSWSVSGTKFTDSFGLSELGSEYGYEYILKSAAGSELARTTTVVKPNIIVVLVRGYAPRGNGFDSDYWTSKESEQALGLVESVKEWFEKKNIICWDASEVLNGRKNVVWNAEILADYIKLNRAGDFENAKVNLLGHSMGGLIARVFAHYNPTVVNNIFTFQTPHAGTPLAEIETWLRGEARENLSPSFADRFNKKYPPNVPLYLFCSNDHKNVLNDPFYKILNSYREISSDYQFSFGGDGPVPYMSGYGAVYEYVGRTLVNMKLEMKYELRRHISPNLITGSMNTGFDHSTTHRHPNTLNKVMEWLGYPQPQALAIEAIMPMDTGEPQEESPLYYIAGFGGYFDSQTPVSQAVQIGNTPKAYFNAFVSEPNCIFTLTGADGTVITPETIDANVHYYAEDSIAVYEITSPVAGQWFMNLTTTINPPKSVEYSLSAFEDAQILFSVVCSSKWANTTDGIMIEAEISDNSGSIADAEITAVITLPNGATENLTFVYDSQTHIYNCQFNNTLQEGRYNIEAKAIGLSQGESFERRATSSFTASAADIAIIGAITDQGIHTDSNGYSNALRFTVPVAAQTAKWYRLTAFLYDSEGEQIKLVNTGQVFFSPAEEKITGDLNNDKKVDITDFQMFATLWNADGCNNFNDWCNWADSDYSGEVDLPDLQAFSKNWLLGTVQPAFEFEITAEEITSINAAGPYSLRNIQVSDAETALVICDWQDYTTGDYAVSDFEPLDSDGDSDL